MIITINDTEIKDKKAQLEIIFKDPCGTLFRKLLVKNVFNLH